MFTQFWDMHSGGSQQESFECCYIEAPMKEAKVIFYNRFGHNPERVTCACCGHDYSVTEYETLAKATAYHRGCKSVKTGESWEYVEEHCGEDYRPYSTLAEYEARPDVLVIHTDEITDDERVGLIPYEEFDWVD